MDTGFQQVDSNKFLITIPNADAINHVVVFMTGQVQLPPGTASCIYFSLPDPNAPPTWNYLGFLTSEKPSAIYKLTNLTKTNVQNSADPQQQLSTFNYTQLPVVHVAQIGISVEPLDSVIQMVPALDTPVSNMTNFAEFITKTVGNLFNYCSSFSRPASEIMGNPFQVGPPNSSHFVPLSTIQTWYENYTRRLSNDPNFWKTLN